MAKRNLTNARLFGLAKQYLVGGVNSPVRSFSYVGGRPLLLKNGKGCRVFDYEGRSYIDFVLSWGSLILGHAHHKVVKAVRQAAGNGLSLGATHDSEIRLAKKLRQAIPLIEKVRFTNSGTEAVMGAVRLARGYTGRDIIIKFENAYHGHADYLLAKAGSGLATQSIPVSSGVPRDFLKSTLVAPYGDISHLKEIFRKYRGKIAAVLVEPAGGNFGVIPPDTDFLRFLRGLTRKHGALLIFDEVITGFRFRYGALSERLGVSPDIACLGKIIGAGLPIGAYGGSWRVMRYLAPEGKVYQASTFAGNPVVMQAGLQTLDILSKQQAHYRRLEELAAELALGIKKEADRLGVPLKVSQYGPMFSLRFSSRGEFSKFYRRLLEQGVYLAPSEYEANFVSFAHTQKDIKITIDSARRALWKM